VEPRPRIFYGWILLTVLWALLTVSMGASVYGSAVINAAMAADLHLDRSALGSAFALFQWTSGLPGPLVAWCVNRTGVRFTLIAGFLILFSGALTLAMLVQTAAQFNLAFGVVIGVAAVVAGPLAPQATITRWFVRRRAMAMSLMLTAPAVGGFLAAPMLDRVITAYHGNWRAAWWVVAAAAIVCALAAFFLVKETPQQIGQLPDGQLREGRSSTATDRNDENSTRALLDANFPSGPDRGPHASVPDIPLGQIVRTSTFWLMILSVAGLFAGFMLFAAHGVIHLQDLGFTSAQAAASFSMVFLSLLGGNLLFAAIGDHFNPRFVLSAASAAFAAGLALALNPSGTLGLYVYPILLGGGFGVAFSTMMVLPGSYFGDKAYVSIVGIMLALSTTYGALGALGAGFAYDHFGNYAPAFHTAVVLSVVGSVLALFLTPANEPARHPIAM
jgi:MFS family permease